MNDVLQKFVADTKAQFAGRMKTPRDLMQNPPGQGDFVDVAVLGGYSLRDILHGRIAEADIDPAVIRAFHQQYPHAGEFIDFIWQHSGDKAALAGIVSGVKGKLFETEYLDWLNHGHLPPGALAELAKGPTQEGWDIVIKDSHGHVLEYLQLKATDSLSYVKAAYEAHPEIDVVATHEVFGHLDDSGLADHVTASSFVDAQLTEHVSSQIHAVELTPEFGFPLLAFGMIAAQNYLGYRKGRLTATEAVTSGIKRGWRAVVCRGAAYAAILISHEPVVGLPASVLTRLTFSRFDVQRRFVALIRSYRAALRARAQQLGCGGEAVTEVGR